MGYGVLPVRPGGFIVAVQLLAAVDLVARGCSGHELLLLARRISGSYLFLPFFRVTCCANTTLSMSGSVGERFHALHPAEEFEP